MSENLLRYGEKMHKMLITMILLAFVLTVGCEQQQQTSSLAATGTEGVLESTTQRNRRISYINNIQSRELVDDWDSVWMYERSSHLTPYIIHVGP